MTDFTRLAKVDLHVHLDGSLRPGTIADLIRAAGKPVPDDVEHRCRVSPQCRSLHEFLDTFVFFYPYIGNAAALHRAARELCADQAADHVAYFETRFAPTLWTASGFPAEEAVEAALAGLAEGAAETGVKWGLILCGVRTSPPATTIATVKLAHRYFPEGVVGVDLAGDERHPAAAHAAGLALARKLDIPITLHAGEAGPAANVREALDLGAVRIGHGIHAADDPSVVERARVTGTTFEMCLTSNLQTASVRSIGEHPFAAFLRSNVRVTLNTDDPGVQGSTLSQDYALAESAFGITREEFLQSLAYSVDAAFADDSVKKDLKHLIENSWNPPEPRR